MCSIILLSTYLACSAPFLLANLTFSSFNLTWSGPVSTYSLTYSDKDSDASNQQHKFITFHSHHVSSLNLLLQRKSFRNLHVPLSAESVSIFRFSRSLKIPKCRCNHLVFSILPHLFGTSVEHHTKTEEYHSHAFDTGVFHTSFSTTELNQNPERSVFHAWTSVCGPSYFGALSFEG